MSGELTVLNNQSSVLETGGLGINFNDKLFKLKPATLTIVQPQSTIEGATKGNLRITETGQEFTEMYCSLLVMPQEQRQWYIGERGELNKIPENLMCFSTNMVQPHEKSKIPQAPKCANCSKQDWGPYQEYKKANNGNSNKKLIPSCEAFYKVFLIDTVYQLPLKMFIRSKAKESFELGMQNVARTIAMAKAQKKNPNIFDVKFKLTTQLVVQGPYKWYVPIFSEPRLVNDEERGIFGAMYMNFTNSALEAEAEETEEATIQQSQKDIDTVVEGEYLDNKEITI